jgi:hypothetical protein
MTNLLNTTTDQSNTSWRNDYLKNALHNGVVEVLFLKKDGTERRLICTLKADLLPAQTDLEEAVQKKTPNPDVLAVWDTENQGWRSFRYDSIIGFTEQAQ